MYNLVYSVYLKSLRLLSVLCAAVLIAAACPAYAAASSSVDSNMFISQSAALETSTVRGLISDISAQVRGPASSYTLTVDSSAGDDLKALLVGTRYNLIECYDLSLTAVNDRQITRNPQFGDVTITIPIGSSMNPAKGTFAIYTVGTDGGLERLPCTVIYGRSTAHAVRFMTIHFSTYAIVYTSGGSTRVMGSREEQITSGAGGILNNNNNTTTAGNSVGNNAVAPATGSADQAAAAATPAPTTAGKDEYGRDPYYQNPKTGDRRHYELIIPAILAVSALLFITSRIRSRRTGS